jgi:hypothetical protein
MRHVRIKFCFAVVVVLILFSASAFADTISGTGGDGWQTWVAANANGDGKPYWDGSSTDGTNASVGNYLTNTGYFSSGNAGPGAIPFWGGAYISGSTVSVGAADQSFYFTKTGTSDLAALKIEVAGNADVNVFGWYDVGSPSTLHPIFTGLQSAGDSATFIPSTNYGFYFKSSPTSGTLTYLTQSNLSQSNDNGNQHFAVFQDGSSFWIGMEDLAFSGSDKDYNDMIVKVSSTSVPEPATMLLLGLGLFGVAGIRRKIKK